MLLTSHLLLSLYCSLIFGKQTPLFEKHLVCHRPMLPIQSNQKFCCLVRVDSTTKFRLLKTLIKKAWRLFFSLKTLLEMEKMLVTSIFSFSHNVLHPFQNKFILLSTKLLDSNYCNPSIWINVKFCHLVSVNIWTHATNCTIITMLSFSYFAFKICLLQTCGLQKKRGSFAKDDFTITANICFHTKE